MDKPVKQFKMGIHRNLITRKGDKEIKGYTVKWKPGINPLAEALDKAFNDEQDTTGLRRTTERKKQR